MDSPNQSTPFILVAEDEETDAMILRRAFRDANVPCSITVVSDGSRVIDYLEGNGPYQDRTVYPAPSLLLMDLKMPRMNGFDVLQWLADKPAFRELPVVVLSSSAHATDIEKALATGARDYQIKPLQLSAWVEMVKTIVARWLKV
jgi:CheY-like chemotaxis protein